MNPPSAGSAPLEPGELRWRCRRGMKELDILLSNYLSRGYSDAAVEEQAAFRRVLELPDPVLYDLCFGHVEAGSAELATLIARILDTAADPR